MTDHEKAIEAAARALCQSNAYDWVEQFGDEWRKHAAPTIAAYLAALGEAGYAVVNVRQIEVASGPPIYDTARPLAEAKE